MHEDRFYEATILEVKDIVRTCLAFRLLAPDHPVLKHRILVLCVE